MGTIPRSRSERLRTSQRLLRWAACALMAGFAWSAQASDDAQQEINFQAMGWASSCVTCHGAGTEPEPGQTISTIAGMDVDDFVEKMENMHFDERPGMLMGQIAKGYDMEGIRALDTRPARQGDQE